MSYVTLYMVSGKRSDGDVVCYGVFGTLAAAERRSTEMFNDTDHIYQVSMNKLSEIVMYAQEDTQYGDNCQE